MRENIVFSGEKSEEIIGMKASVCTAEKSLRASFKFMQLNFVPTFHFQEVSTPPVNVRRRKFNLPLLYNYDFQ